MPPARHARRLRLEPLESRALPSFSPVVTYPTAAHESVAVAVGDFNGDGKPDLAVGCEADFSSPTSTVSVLLGNGGGTFRAAVSYPAGRGLSAVATADVNGDGKLDLITANGSGTSLDQGGNDISVLLDNGDGTFRAPLTFAAGSNPTALVVGDFNGDGSFGTPAVVSHEEAFGAIAVADFNGDGTPDILTAPGGAGGSRVKAFDGQTGLLLMDFAAFDTDIAGGLFVTAP
jgi:hypothetical protein